MYYAGKATGKEKKKFLLENPCLKKFSIFQIISGQKPGCWHCTVILKLCFGFGLQLLREEIVNLKDYTQEKMVT
jgi:hypothetical protein